MEDEKPKTDDERIAARVLKLHRYYTDATGLSVAGVGLVRAHLDAERNEMLKAVGDRLHSMDDTAPIIFA